jgi:hypothetical protein
VLKTTLGDRSSPILYGYDQTALAVYFNQAPIFALGGGGFGGGRGGPNIPGIPNMQPNAVQPRLTTLDGSSNSASAAGAASAGQGGRGRGGRSSFAGANAPASPGQPRVILSFPTNPNDLLLSGVLVNGEAIAGHPVVVDAPLGSGHVVMFANRPFWRWETQGNFFLAFNAILNWNHLDAGRAAARPASTQQ